MKKLSPTAILIAGAIAGPVWLVTFFYVGSTNKIIAAAMYGVWLAIAFYLSRYFRGHRPALLLAETFATTSGCIFLAFNATDKSLWLKVLAGFLAYSVVGTFLGQKAQTRAGSLGK